MFPNCSHEACNDYPVCSGTQGFCNESVPEITKWPLCVNGLSKSVARVEALEDLSLHVHDLKPGIQRHCCPDHGSNATLPDLCLSTRQGTWTTVHPTLHCVQRGHRGDA